MKSTNHSTKNPYAKKYAQASDAELGLSPERKPAKKMSLGEDDTPEADRIPVNGFRQVIEMLKIADPEFRESLLKRLGARDPVLARAIRRDLGI